MYLFKRIGLFLIGVLILACGSVPAPVSAALSSDELDAAIRETSDYLNKQLPRGNKLLILNIQSEFPALSEYIIDELIANTVNDRVFSVVDRRQLDTIRAELGFQMSGEVNDETAQSVGQMTGAQIIISGAISRIGDLYRLRVRALSVQSAEIEGQFNRNIPNGSTVAALVQSQATGYGSSANYSGSGSVQATAPVAPVSQPTLVAPVQYTITFNANGASGMAPSAQTVLNGESIIIPDIGAMTNAWGTFGGWNTRANGTGTPYVAGDSFIVTANSQLYAQWIEKVYMIGETGPAGGFIFYDKGVRESGWRYLEAAPIDFTDVQWSASSTRIEGTGTGIGDGRRNTQLIIAEFVRLGETSRAAQFVVVYDGGGYTDWFLPSRDELNVMYRNLKQKGVGNFSNDWYWSSSTYTISVYSGHVYRQRFSNGFQEYTTIGGSATPCSVRAIRAF
ncbi:MAG: InlB B-repeat-containing protein [Treponema sp.]|jgi:hypothetical protein|nr:InlB B-repeat-containing protein [Treponema sp.]